MVPNDNRFTNLTVDQTLLVKNKLVVNQLDANTLNIGGGGMTPTNGTFHNLTTTNLTATNITTANETVTDGSSSNVLFISDPSTIQAGMIPQFAVNGQTKVVAVNLSQATGAQANYFFMYGSDGNVTISGTTTLTRDMYYDTLTITSTGVVIPAGWFIYCKTACINNGAIRMNGANGANGAGGVGGAGGLATPVTGPSFPGPNGLAGGNTNTNGASTTSSNTVFGGASSNGGNSDTKTGGAIVPNPPLQYLNPVTVIGNIAFFALLPVSTQSGVQVGGGDPGQGGGGGAGGSVGAGGGGGGPGGWIFVIAKSVSGSGTFEAKGGNGGSGQATAGAGGAGGGGGVVYILSSTNTIASSQVLVSGGSGGLGTAGGQVGAAGLAGLYQSNLLT